MKNLFGVVAIMLLTVMTSCNTKDCECTGYDAQGNALYIVDSRQECENKLLNAGDYCACEEEDNSNANNNMQDCECTGYDAQENALYIVNSRQECEDKLLNAGDYCICESEDNRANN